jgi:hypothetical protein
LNKLRRKARRKPRHPARFAYRCIDSHTFCSRLADTGIGVRSSWANRKTRNSSSIQRNSTIRGSAFSPADFPAPRQETRYGIE